MALKYNSGGNDTSLMHMKFDMVAISRMYRINKGFRIGMVFILVQLSKKP